jgi:hypothetical protein
MVEPAGESRTSREPSFLLRDDEQVAGFRPVNNRLAVGRIVEMVLAAAVRVIPPHIAPGTESVNAGSFRIFGVIKPEESRREGLLVRGCSEKGPEASYPLKFALLGNVRIDLNVGEVFGAGAMEEVGNGSELHVLISCQLPRRVSIFSPDASQSATLVRTSSGSSRPGPFRAHSQMTARRQPASSIAA